LAVEVTLDYATGENRGQGKSGADWVLPQGPAAIAGGRARQAMYPCLTPLAKSNRGNKRLRSVAYQGEVTANYATRISFIGLSARQTIEVKRDDYRAGPKPIRVQSHASVVTACRGNEL
jgi:hypothetical protein